MRKQPIRTERKSATAPHRADAVARRKSRGPRNAPPVVGIGASAGGLEALEQFLSHVPPKGGLAIVVVQHLDPTRKGAMPSLLQRFFAGTVQEAKHRTKVRPNCVYVIPPNKDLSIVDGTLRLQAPTAPRGLRLPIDHFLHTLAIDQGIRAVGVILSGMGADGTLGLRAIKENGGLALVQEPETAKFDGMPSSAIDAGVADFVAPPAELPGRIFEFLRHRRPHVRPEPSRDRNSTDALNEIFGLLRARSGHDFSEYKSKTLFRRIERRLALHQLDTLDRYVQFLRESSQEIDLLGRELLIGVTSFFREPAVWQHLLESALPPLLARHLPGTKLRAWVPGCSTGEEAYSLAIVLIEAIESAGLQSTVPIQIFASDLDDHAVAKARQGTYGANIASQVASKRLARFFVNEGGHYRVRQSLRDLMVFAAQDLIKDPPFTKIDVLSCRNLLIYVSQEMQQKLLRLFHYSLRPDGLLVLGSAEHVGPLETLLVPVSSKLRIFRRAESTATTEWQARAFPPLSNAGAASHKGRQRDSLPTLESQIEQLLLQQFVPSAVLVTRDGDILHVVGHTGKYLEPAAGKANWNIHYMAREGLRGTLTEALRQLRKESVPITRRGLMIESGANGNAVDVTLQPIVDPASTRGLVLIVFSDVRALPAARTGGRAAQSAQAGDREALRQAQIEVRAVREEMRVSQEQLQSMNEELQSTNEELQSANEELMTSKEEMQSMNEELHTVNAELRSKLESLASANNDLKNLLNSTDIAILFLDSALRIRRFTDQTASIIKLIPGDIGRPLGDVVSSLVYPDLEHDIRQTLHTLAFSEKEIPTTDSRWFQVRIMPYRTLDNVIDGVVVTFSDISVAKTLEAELRKRAPGG